MTLQLLKTYLPKGPALVATVGFSSCGCESDAAPVLGLGHPVETVDLDNADPGVPLSGVDSGVVALYARSYTDLRRAVSLGALLPDATHFIIVVAQTSRYRQLGLPSASPEWQPVQRVQAYQHPISGWAIEARFRRPTSPRAFLSATAQSITRPKRQPLPRVALAGVGSADWRPGDQATVLTTLNGPVSEPEEYPPADVVLRTTSGTDLDWLDPRVSIIDRRSADLATWGRLGKPESGAVDSSSWLEDVHSVPPVDEHSVNPIGFIARPGQGIGELTQSGDHWEVRAEGFKPLRVPPSGAVTDADIEKLRPLRGVEVNWGRHTGPTAAVRSIAGLSAAGVPVFATEVPIWAGALGSELSRLLTDVNAKDLDDDLRREEHSIRLRRAALRTHSTEARWRNFATGLKLSMLAPPTVSVLLCTKRPEFVPFALAQIARQRHVNLEVILILHGAPSDQPEVKEAVAGFPWPITILDVPGEVIFGDALNRGSEIASGDFVSKWDDDDWYGPEFLSDLLMAASYTGAELVGCVHQFIYLEQLNLTVYRPSGEPERRSKHVTGNSLLIDRHTFNDLGRFRPLARQEDRSLLLAVESAGGQVYRSHGFGSVIHRRPSGHTWQAPVTHFLRRAAHQWHGFRPSALLELDEIRRILAASKGTAPYNV